jgi:hypothetical protein
MPLTQLYTYVVFENVIQGSRVAYQGAQHGEDQPQRHVHYALH